MAKGKRGTRDRQLGLIPQEGVDWSCVEATKRVWLDDVGGDHGARLEFLAEQGLRLIMVDHGPGDGETLHFFNPRDDETLHIKAGGSKSLLPQLCRHFPEAARRKELLCGVALQMSRADAVLLEHDGLLLEIAGGRVWGFHESWMEYSQTMLHGAKGARAVELLEEAEGMEGRVRTLAFVQALEDARGMNVPVAAMALRTSLLELARVLVHLAWIKRVSSILGRNRTADVCGDMQNDLREGMVEWLGESQGRGWLVAGGLREDFPLQGAQGMSERLASLQKRWDAIAPRVLSLPVPRWAERRLAGWSGEVDKGGLVGPLARAAGLDVDVREEEPGVYSAVGWAMARAPRGTGIFRRMLAIKSGEIASSLEVSQRILEEPPEGPLLVKRGRGGRGEGFGRCAGPAGEICCHLLLRRGHVSYVAFSLPHEINRCAASCLEGSRLDEVELLSLLWEDKFGVDV